ncbi:hypothetical protein E1295_24035 [Nonomuraea mesophila]|uniref:Uncharacterized protein n=1 Tax=Nonomuraea mesophila TaxID=2530382 RepID=A0A4R5FA86_9ACTN|nr:hypothetical protein [Nonomuraea mesophila]TDE45721.1 hypothetical protein E1295_24035 [Nonomuraea mesophila]
MILGLYWQMSPTAGTTLTWSDRRSGARLELTLVRHPADAAADERTLPRNATDDTGREGRSRAAAIRRVVGPDSHGRVWREKDTPAVLHAEGVSEDDVDALVKELRVVDARDRDRIRATVIEYPARKLLDPGLRMAPSGRTATDVWAVGVKELDDGVQVSVRSVSGALPFYDDHEIELDDAGCSGGGSYALANRRVGQRAARCRGRAHPCRAAWRRR